MKAKVLVHLVFTNYPNKVVTMMVSEHLHIALCEELSHAPLLEVAGALFPSLPFGLEQADEVVWIEGTMTVSF